jgi:hypothetical protein
MISKENQEALLEIIKLEQNWDGYNAIPIGLYVFYNTIKLLDNIKYEHEIYDIFPNPQGTISVTWQTENGKISVEIGKETMSYYYKNSLSKKPEFYSKIKINEKTIHTLEEQIKLISQ